MKNNTLKQHTFMETVKARWELWLLLAPFLVLFILLTVVPVVSSIVLSFFDFDMVSLPSWSGVDNYLRAFIQDDLFPIVLKKTLVLFSFRDIWATIPGGTIFSESLKTLPTVMSTIGSGGIARSGASMAASVLMMIPPIVVYLISQSSIKESMSSAGIKG